MIDRIEDKYLAQAFFGEAVGSLPLDVAGFVCRVQGRAKALQAEAKAPLGYYCSICATTFKTPKNCGAGNCPQG